MKFIKWVAWNIVLDGLLYAGIGLGIEGAWNVYQAFFWFGAFIGLAAILIYSFDEHVQKAIAEKTEFKPKKPWWCGLQWGNRFANLAVLVWFSHAWIAILFMTSLALVVMSRHLLGLKETYLKANPAKAD